MSITPNNLSSKGICIDDTTAGVSAEKFNWPCLTSQPQFLRTYHYSEGVSAKGWIAYCVTNSIPVMVGLDLGSDNGQSDINAFSADYLASPSEYDTNVISIAIGNEATSVSSMVTGITYAKTLQAAGKLPKNALITTVLAAAAQWFTNGSTYPPASTTFSSDFKQLLPHLDVIAFNCYGGYFLEGDQGISLSNSLSWSSTSGSVLLNQFAAIRAAMSAAGSNLKFWCTETGWNSDPGNPSWSNIANLKTFYTNFLEYTINPTNSPDKIFYFSAKDVPGGQGGAGFGLYTASGGWTSKIQSC